MKEKTIYAIILNYNNYDDTVNCINSFDEITAYDIRIVLVDNASEKDCADKLEAFVAGKGSSRITFIRNNENLGYAAGNNTGIKEALKQGAEYLAIVNNDVLVNADSFTSSMNLLDEDERIAFAGPAILEYKTDKIQYTGGIINYLTLMTPHLNEGEEYQKSDKTIECDYVGGACMLFKAGIIDKIGLIPEDYFLFWEETEWCAKARQMGFKCVCTLGGYVKHKGSATIKKIKGLESYYFERNRIMFSMRNDHNIPRKICAIVRAFMEAFAKGILRDRVFFTYFPYYIDGIKGVDNYKEK